MSNLYVSQTVNGDLQPVKVNGESSALEIASDEVKVLALEIDGVGTCREPTVDNHIASKRYVDSSGGGGSGDMTGVDITAGDGIDITQSGTTSGDYTATLSTDLKSNGGVVIESTELAVDLGASSITGTLAVSDGGTGLTSLSTLTNVVTALNDATESELVTVGSTTTELDAESGLTYNGSTLAVSGDMTLTGDLAVNGNDITFDASASTVSIDASAHNAVGEELTISAGNTTAGLTNNIAGGSLTIAGGRGKGSGAGGSIVFKTANEDSSGSTLNALATALQIYDDLSASFSGIVQIRNTTSPQLSLKYDSGNYAQFEISSSGDLEIETVGAGSLDSDIKLNADGDVIIDADGGNITLQDGGSTYTPSANSDAVTKAYTDSVLFTGRAYSTIAIKVYPTDFRVNDDYVRQPNIVEDDTADTLGFRVTSTNEEAYAFVPIPRGYSATHVQVYSNDTTALAIQCKSFNYVTGATVNLESFALGTNQDITDVDGDSLDLIIKYEGLSITTLIYGATVTIAAN